MRNAWKTLIYLLGIVLISPAALSASGVTYHGRILRANSEPINGQFVGFRLRVMDGDTGTCQMYEEIQTKDMRNSGGVFSIIIGDGSVVGTYGVTGVTFFDGLFQNDKTFNFSVGHPCVGSPYSADTRDGRKLNVSFRESPTDAWEDMPVMSVEYVPMAFHSLVAQKVGNHGDGSLLRVENAGTPQNIAALTPTQYSELFDLVSGNSTQYIQSVLGTAGQISVNTAAGVATVGLPDVATAGTYGSATQVPVFVLDAKGRITSVTNTTITGAAPTGVAGGDLTGNFPNPDIAASAVGTAEIAALAVTDAKLAANSVTTTKILDANVTLDKLATDSVNSAKIVDGSIVGADISSTAALSVASVTATGAVTSDSVSTRSIGLFELPVNGTNYIAMKAPDLLAGNTTYTWPAAAPGSNMVLQSDASGNLSWVADATGAANAFVQSGNAFGATAVLGTTDTNNLQLITSNAARMTIDATGKVGIGTTNPQDSFHLGSATALVGMKMSNTASGNNLTDGFNFSYNSLSQMTMMNMENSDLIFGTNNTNRMTISNGGDVAIGVGAPTAKLDVKGDFAISGATSGAVKFAVPAAAGSATYTWPAAAPGSNMVLQSDSSGNLSWVADATGGAPSDASYAGKGIVQFDTDAATSGINISGGIAKLATSGVVANTYGAADKVPVIAVDAFGRITSATDTNIALAAAAITSGILDVARGGTGTGTLTANRMFIANGTGTALVADTCTIGQVLQYNGTTWTCLASTSLGPANPFIQSGNAFGAKAVLGTTDNNTLEFITNNTAKMTLLANGYVGIGATAPFAPLQVQGTIASSTTDFVLGSAGSAITVGLGASTGATYSRISALQSGGSAPANLIINDSGGSVGINTTSPSAKLDVKGDFAISGATSGAVKFAVPAAAGSATYTWPAAAPGSNMVLQSDASGVLSWVAAGSANAFVQSGNAFGATALLGTTDNNELRFITNNTEKVTILADGKVGIGITAPGTKLQIKQDTDANLSGLGVMNAGGTRNGTFWMDGDNLRLNSGTGNTPILLNGSGTGSVGINTTSPNAKLDVKGDFAMSGATSGAVKFAVPAAAGSATYTWPAAAPASNMVLQSDSSGVLSWVSAGGGGNPFVQNGNAFGAKAVLGTTDNNTLEFITNSTAKMTVLAGGNVGIGTASPGSKLDVSGDVNANSYTFSSSATALQGSGGSIDIVTGSTLRGSFYNTGVMSWFGRMQTGDLVTPQIYGGTTSAANIRIDGTAHATPGNIFLASAGGNVGVNTTSPNAKLDVKGDFAISGSTSGAVKFAVPAAAGSATYTWPAAAPASDMVLQSDSSGVLSWVAAGAGGLTNFTEGLNSTAPNNTVPIASLVANNAATNVDVAISPKGSGALTAQIADSAVTGGNKRGQYAVDLQLSRSVATYVASGLSSVIAGGTSNTASGSYSAVLGGSTGVASGNNTVIGGGLWNTASGHYSAILGGQANTSSGQYSSVVGGHTNTASGQYSLASGDHTTAESYAQTTFGRYNMPKGSETAGSWVATDPLFVLGNGTGSGASRSTALMILKDGSTGIGTVPTAKLDVKGDFAMSGATSGAVKFAVPAAAGSATYTWPAAAPASNMVLQSDASGTLSWVSAGGGGVTDIDGLSDAKANASNVFLGASSGNSLSSGTNNVGVGVNSGTQISTGSRNIVMGYYAGQGIIAHSDTTAIGNNTLYKIASGKNGNTAIGSGALFNNGAGVGEYNTSIGYDSMKDATGNYNVAAGANALDDGSSGSHNVAFGQYSGSASSGSNNITMGQLSLTNSSGSDNILLGREVFFNNGSTQTGAQNVVIGSTAASTNGSRTASNNVILGFGSGKAITSASSNVIIGKDAGNTLTTGGSNILIGASVVTPANSTSNYLNIGNTIYGNTSTGDVGIGTTTTPNGKLDVKGTLAISGSTSGSVKFAVPAAAGSATYTWPAAAPASNMVLQSTSAGVLSWVAAGGGGSLPAADGTASAPSISFTSDTNTGIYRVGSDVMGFSANGGPRMTLDEYALNLATGYGDGLRVNSGGAGYGLVTISSDNGQPGRLRFADGQSSWAWDTAISRPSAGKILVDNNAGGAATLEVKGTMSIAGTTSGAVKFAVPAAAGSATYTWPAAAPASNMVLQSTSAGVLSWVAAGGGGGLPAADGTSGAPSIAFTSDTDTGIYRHSANTIGFAVGGSSKMLLASSGLSIASANLDVNGGILADGNIVTYSNLNVAFGDAAIDMGNLSVSMGNILMANDPLVGLFFGATKICGNTGCTAVSDGRYKENIMPLENSLDKVLQLQGVSYDWIDKKKFGDKHQVGMIAQEIEKVYPEVVNTDKETGLKTVMYDHLVGPLVESVKSLYARLVGVEQGQAEQSRRLASVESEMAAKDAKIQKLEQENAAIKAWVCQKDPEADICH